MQRPIRHRLPPASRLALLLLTLATPWPALAAAPPAACADGEALPLVLDVGVPLERAPDPALLAIDAETLFGAIYRAAALCPARPLQLNLAVGTDYQILDWLGRGSLDAAVVPALSHHLLLRDGVGLEEIDPPPEAGERLTPAQATRYRSFDVAGSRRTPRDEPEADLAAFRAWLWSGLADDPRPFTVREARRRPELCEELYPRDGTPYRLTMPSHLSTAGTLRPIAATHRWFEDALTRRPEDLRPVLRECFWRSFFHHSCFDLGATARDDREEAGAATACGATAPASGRWIEVRAESAPAGAAGGEHDRLLLRSGAAEAVFVPGSFRRSTVALPAEIDLSPLYGALGDPHPDVPGPFRAQVLPEPSFGVRTFAFTVDESLRLLRLHQETSARSRLALILPGGGVKAAFQSGLIDHLYDSGHLRNAFAEPAGGRPLLVDYVIGTSGGALLGFFVARLSPRHAQNLADVLWMQEAPDGAGELVPLSSSDIFPWNDLLRYVSLIAILLVFGVFLALASVPRRGPLSPEHLPPAPDAPAAQPRARLRLLAVLLGALVAAPLLVEWVSGDRALEHVPEIEGLIFAVLVTVAMFADQCLIWQRPSGEDKPPAPPSFWVAPGLLVAAGLVLALAPGAASWTELAGWLRDDIRFGDAYLILGASTVGLLLASVRRPVGWRQRLVLTFTWVGGFAVASALAAGLLWVLPTSWLERLDRIPLLFLSLVVPPVVLGLTRLARSHRQRIAGAYQWAQRHARWLTRLPASRIWGRVALPAAVFVACFLVMDLCRPEARRFADATWRAVAAQPSKLHAVTGALVVMLGLLLVVVGWVLWLWQRSPAYRLHDVRRFVDAMLFVAVGLAFAVYGVLFASNFSMFELTGDFWIGLLVVSAVLSPLLIAAALVGRGRHWLPDRLHGALAYLCARHPNAHLVSRRFARLGLLAVAGLVWWNFVLAPGLYGNRQAREYFTLVQKRFETSVDAPRRLTTRYAAPANLIARDGTRFLLVVPEGEDCPSILQPPGSGVTWYRYRALEGGPSADRLPASCPDLDLTNDKHLDALRSFIFASGSPFPVFPAHRVRLPRGEGEEEGEEEALVDGGYSNHTPVEAAALVEAEQVLIVQSSNPIGPVDDEEESLLARLHGPLVGNALRLPGFLFERSQQADRRSRQRALVVSLSPVWRESWPFLADFGQQTVSAMREAAQVDLRRRIGMVESWGPTRFQVGVLVPPVVAAAEPSVAAP